MAERGLRDVRGVQRPRLSRADAGTGTGTGTDAAVRSGPHYVGSGACSTNGRAYYGQAAQYYCFTTGGDNYNGWTTWTWVYVPAIGRSGWVNDYLLAGNGSNVLC